MATSRGVEREILLAFWKVHILHHASEAPVIGLWILRELREHGYEVSPGTIYPLLARMEERGWLRSRVDARRGPRAPRAYRLTRAGGSVLALLREQVEELHREVVRGQGEERLPAVRQGRGRGDDPRRGKGSGGPRRTG